MYYVYWTSVVKDKAEDKPTDDFVLSHWISSILNQRWNHGKLGFTVLTLKEIVHPKIYLLTIILNLYDFLSSVEYKFWEILKYWS